MIGTESADNILANESTAPEKVARDADGRIVTLYRQYANMGNRDASGIDIDLRHRIRNQPWGSLNLNALRLGQAEPHVLNPGVMSVGCAS